MQLELFQMKIVKFVFLPKIILDSQTIPSSLCSSYEFAPPQRKQVDTFFLNLMS